RPPERRIAPDSCSTCGSSPTCPRWMAAGRRHRCRTKHKASAPAERSGREPSPFPHSECLPKAFDERPQCRLIGRERKLQPLRMVAILGDHAAYRDMTEPIAMQRHMRLFVLLTKPGIASECLLDDDQLIDENGQ